MAYEVEDFQKQVIERSQVVPVVVDFWASWCGPCLAFAPVIEKAASEAGGKWDLVKVDTEKNPDLTEQSQIHSLPTIRIFKNGEMVAENLGAMLLPAFLKWLQPHLGAPTPADGRIDGIRAAIGSGDFVGARALLEKILQEQPGNEEVKFLRLQAAITMEPKTVPALVEDFAYGSIYYERAQYLKELADLINAGGEGPYGEGLKHLQKIHLAEAAEQWITTLTRDRHHEGAKKAMKYLFLYLGREHPVTETYQPRFASVLFS
jgi:putative thioredoxin